MHSKSIVLSAFLWLGLLAAAWAQSGKEVATGKFSNIDLGVAATVYVSQGSHQVWIDATDERDFEALNKKADGPTWHISFLPHSWRQKGKITIYISVPELEKVEITGSGKVIAKDAFSADALEFRLTGSGRIQFEVEQSRALAAEVTGSGHIALAGTTERLEVHITGSGSVDATKLQSRIAEVEVAGSGNARIYALEEIEASVMGSGSVRYAGPARIHSQTIGSGRVSPLE